MLDVKESILKSLIKQKDVLQKLVMVEKQPKVNKFLESHPSLKLFIKSLHQKKKYPLLAMILMGQEDIFLSFDGSQQGVCKLNQMISDLMEVEEYYSSLGGILGYFMTFVSLLEGTCQSHEKCCNPEKTYSKPPYFDMMNDPKESQKFVQIGLENFSKVGAIFPLGGSGDRLGLFNEKTKEPLPAAFLPFFGKTLIELLIRDLFAVENSFFREFGKKIVTPVAVMTSQAKKNHDRILAYFEEKKWFGRGECNFRFFKQLSVPMITHSGKFALKEPLVLALKPGGHGMLWKAMVDQKVFDWFYSLDRDRAFIRQINNPMAGVDAGLLTLIGYGYANNKTLGFASCPRLVNSAEGMNVLIKENTSSGDDWSISNVEYTDLKRSGIEDVCESKKSPYSEFPANTNLFTFNLKKLHAIIKKHPFPGITINVKNDGFSADKSGNLKKEKAGRLEMMMQNIADFIKEPCENISNEQKTEEYMAKKLPTFLTYNLRRKTLSTTKSLLHKNQDSLNGTPEGCYFDYLQNCYELLQQWCLFKVPEKNISQKTYLEKGPPFHFIFHPALGPQFEEIGKKINRGQIALGSEMQLDILELSIEHLLLDGSLIIKSHDANYHGFGSSNPTYCELKNVSVINRGIDWKHNGNIFWKNQVFRKGSLSITLEENASFIARDVTFFNSETILVPKDYQMQAFQEGKTIRYSLSLRQKDLF